MGFAAVLISLLALSGCGGDDSSLSQEEYSQQLELICNEGLQEREKLVNSINREFQEERGGKLTPEYQAENLRKLMAVYQAQTIEKVKELGPPEQNPEKVEKLIKDMEEAAARVVASPLDADGSLDAIFEKADESAKALGVQSCTL
jgi:hypothetical protein